MSQLFSFCFVAFLTLVLFRFSKDKKFFVFLALVPFYHIIRGLSNKSIFFFIWPYFFLYLLIHFDLLKLLKKNLTLRGWSQMVFFLLFNYLLILGFCLTNIFSFLQVFLFPFRSALGRLSAFEIVAVGILLGSLNAVPAAVWLWRRRPDWNAADWGVAAWFAYGIFQVGYTFAFRGTSAFAAADAFRSYFLPSLGYAAARGHLRDVEKVQKGIKIVIYCSFIVAAELVAEYFLFNFAGLDPVSLPWVGYLTETFNYGPAAIFLNPGVIRPMGAFILPHNTALFILLGAIFLAILFFSIHKYKWRYGVMFLFCLGAIIMSYSRTIAFLLLMTLGIVIVAVLFLMRRSFSWASLFLATVSIFVVFLNLTPENSPVHLNPDYWTYSLESTGTRLQKELYSYFVLLRNPALSANDIDYNDLIGANWKDKLAYYDSGSWSEMRWGLFFFGSGIKPLGDYVSLTQAGAGTDSGEATIDFESDCVYFRLFQNFGAFGLVLLLGQFVILLVIAFQLWRRSAGLEARFHLIGASLSVLAIAVSLYHVYAFFIVPVYVYYCFSAAIIGFYLDRYQDYRRTSRQPQAALS